MLLIGPTAHWNSIWKQKVKEPNQIKKYQERDPLSAILCTYSLTLYSARLLLRFHWGLLKMCRRPVCFGAHGVQNWLLWEYKFPLAQWLNTSSGCSGRLDGIIARSRRGLPRTAIERTYLQAAWSYRHTRKRDGSSESHNRGSLQLSLRPHSFSIYTQALSG